jgi:hypothetical protein
MLYTQDIVRPDTYPRNIILTDTDVDKGRRVVFIDFGNARSVGPAITLIIPMQSLQELTFLLYYDCMRLTAVPLNSVT